METEHEYEYLLQIEKKPVKRKLDYIIEDDFNDPFSTKKIKNDKCTEEQDYLNMSYAKKQYIAKLEIMMSNNNFILENVLNLMDIFIISLRDVNFLKFIHDYLEISTETDFITQNMKNDKKPFESKIISAQSANIMLFVLYERENTMFITLKIIEKADLDNMIDDSNNLCLILFSKPNVNLSKELNEKNNMNYISTDWFYYEKKRYNNSTNFYFSHTTCYIIKFRFMNFLQNYPNDASRLNGHICDFTHFQLVNYHSEKYSKIECSLNYMRNNLRGFLSPDFMSKTRFINFGLDRFLFNYFYFINFNYQMDLETPAERKTNQIVDNYTFFYENLPNCLRCTSFSYMIRV